MALFNWVRPDERKTSRVIADVFVDDRFGPRAILRALEEAVSRYISDVDQGKLIYPACKRTLYFRWVPIAEMRGGIYSGDWIDPAALCRC
jgi:hypothetical protein